MARRRLALLLLAVCLVLVAGCASEPTSPPSEDEAGDADAGTEPRDPSSPASSDGQADESRPKASSVPPCDGQRFTEHPADPASVDAFQPLGNIHPPSHTLPSPHAAILFEGTGQIRAPATIFVTDVDRNVDHEASEHEHAPENDYTVGFQLCEDVHAYFQHLEALSATIEERLGEPSCERPDREDGRYEYCSYRVDLVLEPGDPIGTKDGGVEIGLFDDARLDDTFANPDRYREDYRAIQCPLDYATDEVRSALLAKSTARAEDPCGRINYDVPGTLQGNWFHTEGTEGERMNEAWDRQLAFLANHSFSDGHRIVVGGTVTDADTWAFEPRSTGTTNRVFSHVTPDDTIYCYADHYPRKGILLVRMEDEATINLEHRETGECPPQPSLADPTTYRR